MILAIVVLCAIALRFVALDRESLWFDEGWTWWLTTQPADRMFRVIRGDVVAPAYFYLLHAWLFVAGDGEGGLRSLSALLSSLAIVPLVFIARRASPDSWAVAIVAVALFGISTIQVQLARDARPYGLLLLATLVALAGVIRCVERPTRGAFAVVVVAGTLGLYTHNMMPFELVGLAVVALLWPGEATIRRRLRAIAICGAITAALYAPWLPTLREQARFIAGRFWLAPPTLGRSVADAGEIVGVLPWTVPVVAWERFGRSIEASTAALLTVGLAAGLVVAAIASRERRRAFAIAAFALVPPSLVFVYGAATQPLFMPRLFIANGAALAVALAMPLAPRVKLVRLGSAIAIVALLALMAASTSVLLGSPQKEDWRGAYGRIAMLDRSDRRLIVFVATEGELPFMFYAAHDRRTPEPRTGLPGSFFDRDPPQTIRRVESEADVAPLEIAAKSGAFDEIVLVLGHDAYSDPDGLAEAKLRSLGHVVDEWESRHVRVLRVRVFPLPLREGPGEGSSDDRMGSRDRATVHARTPHPSPLPQGERERGNHSLNILLSGGATLNLRPRCS